jgi:adenine-specific DNA-methyltransferase
VGSSATLGSGQLKGRGAFFTPPTICRFIADWAIRSAADDVLEPSCGEAAFLVAAAQRLSRLGQRDVRGHLMGIELHGPSARDARAVLGAQGVGANIRTGDFFDYATRTRVDAVVGNPPYVRYQHFNGTARAKGRGAALRQGVSLSALASSWAAFVVHAAGFLKPQGRLGLVLPAELLTVNYAAPVRSFLMQRFASVSVVLFEERVFPGVTEEVVLLLAEGSGGTDQISLYQAPSLDSLSVLASLPRKTAVASDARWLTGLLDSAVSTALSGLSGRPDGDFVDLAEWGDPNLGMVTGSNNFFAITEKERSDLRLRPDETLSISPPGSRHLRGLTFGKSHWRQMGGVGAPTLLFRPDPAKRLSRGATAKVARGEAVGIHLAYKCRVRHPWYSVPLTPIPDLFFTYMNHDAPRLVTNRAGVRHLNSVHGLRLRSPLRRIGLDLLPLAFLNSATLLAAELVGRSYGGGILKLEPREAERMPVPSPGLVLSVGATLRGLRAPVARALGRADLDAAISMVDDALLSEALGRSTREIRGFRDARLALFSRRVARKR